MVQFFDLASTYQLKKLFLRFFPDQRQKYCLDFSTTYYLYSEALADKFAKGIPNRTISMAEAQVILTVIDEYFNDAL